MARQRQQRSVQDRLIPREVWDAEEARRRARRNHGVDSDEETENEEDDPPRPQAPQVQVDDNDEAQEETIEAVIRQQTINMFKSVLLFSNGAA